MELQDPKEILREMQTLYEKVNELYDSLHITDNKKRLRELEQESYKTDFWSDQDYSARVSQEISRLKRKIEPWDELIQEIGETVELLEMAIDENDSELVRESTKRFDEFEKRFDQLETLELLSEEDDLKNAFLSVHPGAGGTESQDWASMLLRMYMRWAEKNEYEVEVISYMPGEEAGIKDVTILLKGEYAFGLLKGEGGIHRLVRISPFDSNKRRHTSFASVDVIPEVPEDIDLEINENDLKIDTYRASGAGGQHVNKTDSAVRITHEPTGIVVQCQNERSQHKNKASAMKVLKSKIYEMRRKELEDEKLEKMGERKDISWGNQIRSYVFQPYTMVKDHRTNMEIGSVEHVMEGDIDRFLYAYLKSLKQ